MRRALIEILGNAEGYKRATRESVQASNTLSHGLKKLSVDAKASANTQVAASIKRTDRMKREARAFREVASAAKKGSREQVEAANLAARSEAKLARAIGKTNAEAGHSLRMGHRLRGGSKEIRGGLASTGMAGGRALAFSSLGFLGAYGAGSILRSSITEASTLQEETEKTTVLFGKSERQVAAWAKTLATSFGIGEGEALKSAGVFGNMFRSLHFGEAPASKMSERLVQLAADMASFNNASPEDTLKALQSGLAGQVRPLRAYGVFLSADRIKQEAVNSGLVKNAAHLTAAQKVQAAYNIILRDTGLQQGDVARNTGSLSVSQSKLKAALQDSEAIIGKALLPELVKLSNRTATYLERANRTGQLQRTLNRVMHTAGQVLRGLATAFRIARAAIAPFVSLVGGARHAAAIAGLAFLVFKTRALALSTGLFRADKAAMTLRGRLMRLSTLGLITIGIELLINRKQIDKGLDKFTKKHLGNTASKIIGFDLEDLGSHLGLGVKKAKAATVSIAPKGFDPNTHGQAPSTRQNPGGYLKMGSAPAGYQPGTYGQAPSTRDNPGGYLPRRRRAARDAVTGGGGGGTPGRLGLSGRFDKLELQLAKADLTASPGDNRRILTQEAANVRAQLKGLPQDHKHLQERTQLYQQLGQIQSSIQSIDQAAAQKQKDAHDKQLALKKKERERDKKHKAKVEAEEKKQDEQEKKHREALKKTQDAIRAKMTAAVDNARSLIGGLFSGPVLNPSDEQRKRQLGVPGPDAHKLVADVIAQTRAFRGTSRDLGVLRRAGASKQLIGELEGTDPEQLHALATASPKVRKQFLQAFAQRQKAIQSRARFDIHSPHVTVAAKRIDIGGEITVIVHTQNNVDGKQVSRTVTKHQQKASRRTAAQRGGRHPGNIHGIN